MKIKKDNTIVECSKATYESMFKRLGYEIVGENKKVEKVEEIVEIPEEIHEEAPLKETKSNSKKNSKK